MIKLKQLSLKLKKIISNTLYPTGMKCLVCGKELFTDYDKEICEECEKDFSFNNKKTCKKCGVQIDTAKRYCNHCKNSQFCFKVAHAPFVYEGSLKTIVHRMKYQNHRYLFPAFAKYMCDEIVKNNIEFDIIIPVPLHEKRQKERGYNQSELLAIEIGKNLKIDVAVGVLQRVKHTKTQTSLNYEERQKNLDEAFNVFNEEYVKKKKILLVDDVKTTGATIEACSECLCNHGVNEVSVITLCSTNPHKEQ